MGFLGVGSWFFVLCVGVGFLETSWWVVFWVGFWVWFVFWGLLGCGRLIVHVGPVGDVEGGVVLCWGKVVFC